jgi:proline racemase
MISPRTRITAIDSHTCGQPTRVIVDGVPELAYATIAEARDALRRDHDWLRRCAVLEPRGHRSLFGVALVAPTDPASAAGVVFMDAVGYHDMCGHATIGAVTTLVEAGLVAAEDGESELALETPAGRIETRIEVRDGRVEGVTFRNQPAYFLERVPIAGPAGEVDVDISYGGQWYAFVESRAFGLRVASDAIDALVGTAAEMRYAIAAAVTRRDARTDEVARVENVMWTDEPPPGADGLNMAVNSAGAFDRSPCGTGTSARLALLHAHADLDVGVPYVNASVLGTTYTGRIADTTTIGGYDAIIPEITGSAWMTGRGDLWVDPRDPLADGFML